MTSRAYCRHRLRHQQLGGGDACARRAGGGAGRAGAIVHRHAHCGVLCHRGAGSASSPAAAVRPRRDRGVCRRQRRPPDALDEEHPRLRPGRAQHRGRWRPLGALPRRYRQLPAPLEGQGRVALRQCDRAHRDRPAGVLRRRRASARRRRARRDGARGTRRRLRRRAVSVRADRRRVRLRTIGRPRADGAGGRHRRRHLRLQRRARGPAAAHAARPPQRHPRQPRRARGRHRLRPPHRTALHPAADGLRRIRPAARRRWRAARGAEHASTSTSRPGT